MPKPRFIPAVSHPRLSAHADVLRLALFGVTLAGSAFAQQVVTIAPSSGVAPVEMYSGTNYSGVHTNGISINSSGGTDQIDLQITNLPAGSVPYLQSSFVPPTSSSTTFNFLFGIAVTNVAQGDYT